FFEIGKRPAVGKLRGGFDRQALTVGKLFLQLLPFAQRTIPLTFTANGVKMFQRKSGRIDSLVAPCTGGDVAMFIQLLANRGRAADVGFHSRYARWWRRQRTTENAVHDPDAANHWRRGRTVGSYFQHTGL